MRLSRHFSWFGDDSCLLVIGIAGEKPRNLELALAFGLHHAGDRALKIVLPKARARHSTRDGGATQRRLPWIAAPAQLYSFDRSNEVTPLPALSKLDVESWYTSHPPVSRDHELEANGAWVDRLRHWADNEEDLVAAHRSSYLAWHCEGRLVLKIVRTKSGFKVSAGLHSQSDPPTTALLAGPLARQTHHHLVAAASVAMANRIEGTDNANAEHRLQEQLAGAHAALGLRARPRREVPAFRASGERGYIDLLGADEAGTTRVIETKIGPDSMLVLQGLDYWSWCRAHQKELGLLVGADPTREPALDFALAKKDDTWFSVYTAAQLKSLDPSISWRVHTIEHGPAGSSVESSADREVPPVALAKPTALEAADSSGED